MAINNNEKRIRINMAWRNGMKAGDENIWHGVSGNGLESRSNVIAKRNQQKWRSMKP